MTVQSAALTTSSLATEEVTALVSEVHRCWSQFFDFARGIQFTVFHPFPPVESMFFAWFRRFNPRDYFVAWTAKKSTHFPRPARLLVAIMAMVAFISSGMGQNSSSREGGAGLVQLGTSKQSELPVARVGAAGSVIGFSGCNTSGTQTITLVNTDKFWMAVYHVSSDGGISLVSSRPIDADFSVQLNVTDPLPDEIRGLGQ